MEPSKKKILVVEDDEQVREVVRFTLAADYRVLEAETARQGLRLFQAESPDLAVIDVMLPDMDGLVLCRRIREDAQRSATPVIVLTALSALEDKASGVAAGADQYLVKPVRPKELKLWVDALIQRRGGGPQAAIEAGDLRILRESHMVSFRGRLLPDLTPKEFELLRLLVEARPKVLSREAILSRLWDTVTVDHVVDTHMSNLRKKLPPELAARVQNVPGKGFRYFDPAA